MDRVQVSLAITSLKQFLDLSLTFIPLILLKFTC
jgi:hypothetical protein